MWSCQLLHPVIPKLCKMRPAGKRIEVKLRKATSQKWIDLGEPVTFDISNNNNHINDNGDDDNGGDSNNCDGDCTAPNNVDEIGICNNETIICEKNITPPTPMECDSDVSCVRANVQ